MGIQKQDMKAMQKIDHHFTLKLECSPHFVVLLQMNGGTMIFKGCVNAHMYLEILQNFSIPQ
jgi:hypothetical protein